MCLPRNQLLLTQGRRVTSPAPILPSSDHAYATCPSHSREIELGVLVQAVKVRVAPVNRAARGDEPKSHRRHEAVLMQTGLSQLDQVLTDKVLICFSRE
jgi:hypothetical protein